MKYFLSLIWLVFFTTSIFAQSDFEKVYETEKAFERAAATRGINQSFIEFSAPDGVRFFPGYPVNCREFFRSQKESGAALLWNPNFVDVSSNGVIAYTTGNSIYRPQGKTDADAYYGQYISVWQRQPDGKYLAVLDAGISHAKPAVIETKWNSPVAGGKELNEQRSSAADVAAGFFEMAQLQGLQKAYKSYLADDARLLRPEKFPILGKKAALEEIKKEKSSISFTKRSVFSSAADLTYTTNSYRLTDKSGKETEKGNFVQIWKLRDGRWQIVLDIFVPVKA